MSAQSKMSTSERTQLLSLVGQTVRRNLTRLKAAEAEAKARIEEQLTAKWDVTDFPEIAEAMERAKEAERQAQREITAACDRAGIPPQFRPSFNSHWDHGGWRRYARETGLFSIEKVRASIYKHVDAAVAKAKAQVEGEGVQARTQLLAGAFSGEDALTAIKQIESYADLPPPPSLREVVKSIYGFDLPEKMKQMRALAAPGGTA